MPKTPKTPISDEDMRGMLELLIANITNFERLWNEISVLKDDLNASGVKLTNYEKWKIADKARKDGLAEQRKQIKALRAAFELD
jgi:hypothetical protein